MGKPKAEHFWDKNNHKYPHQTVVPHMSPQDPMPRTVQEEVNFHFLRVPFAGEAHYGFLTEADLTKFKNMVGLK